jgi:hypothetical protein
MNIPEKIITKSQVRSIRYGSDYHKAQGEIHERFLDVSDDIYDKEDSILSKIMVVLFEAKEADDNQIIDLSEKLS